MTSVIGVTGASGFVGKHLSDELGPRALALDLRNSSDKKLQDQLEKNNCQTIIHLAHPVENKSQHITNIKKNTGEELTNKLLNVLEPLISFRIIFVSSIRVHSSESKKFSPKSPIKPQDAYGKDKYLTERLLSSSRHSIFSMRVSSIQGVDHKGKAKGIIGIFSRQAVQKGMLKIMGDGKSIKDLIHVLDLCNLIKLVMCDFDKFANKSLPVGGGAPCTLLNLAKKICSRTGAKIKYLQPDPFDLSGQVDNSFIYELSNWMPKVSVDRMIEEAMGYSQNISINRKKL